MTHSQPRISRCPQCSKSCRNDAENPFRPFCSERCKLMDLGDWLDERHVISESSDHPESAWSERPDTEPDH